MDRTIALVDGWQLAHTPPQACAAPDALIGFPTQWHDAVVPGTVAATLHDDINAEGDYDADDWWYRTTFARPDGAPGTRYRLRLDGLATIAEVWLNGKQIAASRNMFVGQRIDVTGHLVDVNQLAIVFRSLDRELKERRVRPRWKTALVEAQNLRWFRTTLLGRMPGWTPPIECVGPWQPVVLECCERLAVERPEHDRELVHVDQEAGHVDALPDEHVARGGDALSVQPHFGEGGEAVEAQPVTRARRRLGPREGRAIPPVVGVVVAFVVDVMVQRGRNRAGDHRVVPLHRQADERVGSFARLRRRVRELPAVGDRDRPIHSGFAGASCPRPTARPWRRAA